MPIIPGLETSQEISAVSCPVVLLVEGRDEVNFFDSLLRHMQILHHYWPFDNGAFANLSSFLKQLTREHAIVDVIEQANDVTENYQ
jgi:hypothetical protein